MTDFQRHSIRILGVALMLLCGPMVLSAQGLEDDPLDGIGGPDSLRVADSIAAGLYADSLRIEEWRVGLYLGINRNIYSVEQMKGLPDVPSCCPGYDAGDGFGVAVGGMVETPISEAVSVGGRLYLNTYNGSLVDNEEILLDREGEPVPGLIEHRIDAEIWSLAIEPVVTLAINPEARVFAGLRGDVIVKWKYDQQERLAEPDDLVFENGSPVRLERNGEIPDANRFYGTFVGGVRYDIYLEDREWAIAPEISFYFSPTPVVKEETWNIYGVRLSLLAQMIEWEEPDDRDRTSDFVPPPTGPPVSLRKEEIPSVSGGAGAGAGAAAEKAGSARSTEGRP